MDDAAQEGALCLICHEGLLTQVPCALRCGHVYHSACCHQWFEKGKSECPQCKAKSSRDDLLLLDFEVAQVQPRSLEEARKLETASAEERSRIREELALEVEDVEAKFREAQVRLDAWREAAQERKRARRELEAQGPDLEAEISRVRADREKAAVENARLGAEVDNQNTRQRQLRPWSRSQESVNEDDPDAKEERRKLRLMRPADRARQLHEAVVSARMQEAEANRASREREAAVKELQEELLTLKKMEVGLRKEIQRRKEQDERPAEARAPPAERTKAAQSSLLAPGTSVLKKPRQAAPSSTESLGVQSHASAGSAVSEPPGGPDDFGDEDLLYGGVAPPPRRAASVLSVARPAAPIPGGRPGTPAPAAMASLATPVRRQNSLQALFSKRKA